MSAKFTGRVLSHTGSVNIGGWSMVVRLENGNVTFYGGRELVQSFPIGSVVTFILHNEKEAICLEN
jgi:hypothetical protein